MPQTSSHAVGLIGRGIAASQSPQIHEGAARELGLALTYRIVDFDALGLEDDRLEEIVRLLAGIGWTGCNITHPFKQQVLAFCDELSEDARVLGAANTLLFHNGRIRGENTDWIGFSSLIAKRIGDIGGQAIAQIGTGGAGSATAYALARLGAAEVALYDPSPARCDQLVARLAPGFANCRFVVCTSAAEAIGGRRGIVQTTPVGMAAHPGMPFDPALLDGAEWLADVIYFPAETALMAAARQRHITAVNGLDMVIGQAAEAFRLFTGHVPDEAQMHRALPGQS